MLHVACALAVAVSVGFGLADSLTNEKADADRRRLADWQSGSLVMSH